MHHGPSKIKIVLIILFTIVLIATAAAYLSQPAGNAAIKSPNYLNLEYFFNLVLVAINAIIAFFFSSGFVGFVRALLSLSAIIFITVIIYTQILLQEIHSKEHKEMEHDIGSEPETGKKKNDKWEKVLALGFSTNQSDWRFAIIEADSILDEMTQVLEYQGATLADRLKQVDPADWKTLQLAWEAHLIRNRIAHDGTDFKLDHDEARRVLGLYERVFKEFDYI